MITTTTRPFQISLIYKAFILSMFYFQFPSHRNLSIYDWIFYLSLLFVIINNCLVLLGPKGENVKWPFSASIPG
jgi:hypothetical protein